MRISLLPIFIWGAQMKRRTTYIIIGLLIIAIGVVYAGDVLGFWDMKFSLDGWWTLFIIVPAVVSMVSGGVNEFNIITAGIGIILLVGAQDLLPDGAAYKLIFPYVLIVAGIFIILRKSKKPSDKGNRGMFSGSQGEKYFAVFGGNTPQLDGVDFRGARAYAIFGGVELRLKNSNIKRDCSIEAYSVFGGTGIFLPGNVHVSLSSVPIFGSVENKFVSEIENSTAPTVYIRAVSIFGGTEIK